MLHKLSEKPPEFKRLQQEYHWFDIREPGEPPVAVLAAIVDRPDQMSIHLELTVPITKGVLELLKETWKEVVDMARFFNVQYIVATGDPMNTTWPKFLKHFGFPEPRVVAIASQEV